MLNSKSLCQEVLYWHSSARLGGALSPTVGSIERKYEACTSRRESHMQNCKHWNQTHWNANWNTREFAVLCSEVAGLEPINLRPGIDVEWQDQWSEKGSSCRFWSGRLASQFVSRVWLKATRGAGNWPRGPGRGEFSFESTSRNQQLVGCVFRVGLVNYLFVCLFQVLRAFQSAAFEWLRIPEALGQMKRVPLWYLNKFHTSWGSLFCVHSWSTKMSTWFAYPVVCFSFKKKYSK